MKKRAPIVFAERIDSRIIAVREQRAILEADPAAIYGVTTERLNEQVKRNSRRFPADFALRLAAGEKREAVATCDRLAALRFSPTLPHALIANGAVMATNRQRSDL